MHHGCGFCCCLLLMIVVDDRFACLWWNINAGDESTKGIVKDGTQIFLHQSPQFSTWLKQAAAYHKLGEFTILREYLVAHVLYSLQACGKRVFLKGGCSLSLVCLSFFLNGMNYGVTNMQGYNLINRTSEDIDIRIDPSAGVTWEVNGCENAETSRAEYFLKLLDTVSFIIWVYFMNYIDLHRCL